MRVKGEVTQDIKRMIRFIQRRDGDCEPLLRKYNQDPYNATWYGKRLICEPLFCCYGLIGYSIQYDGYDIHVDNDLDIITIIE